MAWTSSHSDWLSIRPITMNTTVVISVLAGLFIGSHSVLGRVLHFILIHIEQGKGVLFCVKCR